MLDRIDFVHYTFDTSVEQYDLIVQFIENFLCRIAHINIMFFDIILHFHVNEEVIESGLSFGHMILRHLIWLDSLNFFLHLSLIQIIVLQALFHNFVI